MARFIRLRRKTDTAFARVCELVPYPQQKAIAWIDEVSEFAPTFAYAATPAIAKWLEMVASLARMPSVPSDWD